MTSLSSLCSTAASTHPLNELWSASTASRNSAHNSGSILNMIFIFFDFICFPYIAATEIHNVIKTIPVIKPVENHNNLSATLSFSNCFAARYFKAGFHLSITCRIGLFPFYDQDITIRQRLQTTQRRPHNQRRRTRNDDCVLIIRLAVKFSNYRNSAIAPCVTPQH